MIKTSRKTRATLRAWIETAKNGNMQEIAIGVGKLATLLDDLERCATDASIDVINHARYEAKLYRERWTLEQSRAGTLEAEVARLRKANGWQPSTDGAHDLWSIFEVIQSMNEWGGERPKSSVQSWADELWQAIGGGK